MQTKISFSQSAKSKRIFNSSFLILAILFISSIKCSAHNFPTGFTPSYLVSFTADCNNYFAQIKWTTSQEMAKGIFVIERTKDGVHFETIATLKNSASNGPTTVAHEYNVVDESPFSGISYYRISEIDSTEKKVHINTIVYRPCVNEETINAIMEETGLTVSVNSICMESNSCNVTVIDKDANIVLDQAFKVVNGMNCFKIDTRLNNGSYTLLVDYRNHSSFKKEFELVSTEK